MLFAILSSSIFGTGDSPLYHFFLWYNKRMRKDIKVLTIILISLLLVNIHLSCRFEQLPATLKPISYLHNEHLHLHSIPRPYKRIEVHANGSIALRNATVTFSDGTTLQLEGENATFYFTPTKPGQCTLQYEFTYTNHFEHINPENPDTVAWESGTFQLDVTNPIVPDDYQATPSKNGKIKIYLPNNAKAETIQTFLEIQPPNNPSLLSINMANVAIFPEAYTFYDEGKVLLQLNLEKEHYEKGILFELLDKTDPSKIIDSLEIQNIIKTTPVEKVSFLPDAKETPAYLQDAIFLLEEGNLKLWHFQRNEVSVFTNELKYLHLAISPDRKCLALSTLTDTYLMKMDDLSIKKIVSGYNKPIFITNNSILLVGANDWPIAKSSTYGNITIQHNVYQMPLAVYNLNDNDLIIQASVSVFLGDRWSMYYPKFSDLPVNLVPFERSKEEYLVKIISPGLEAKWIQIHREIVKDYTLENTPWIAEKPYIFNEFLFKGEIQSAILKKVTYNNQEEVLYVDDGYASLSFPEEKGRYVSFVRSIQDNLSAPSFYIETKKELCVFDKVMKKTYFLPITSINDSCLSKH